MASASGDNGMSSFDDGIMRMQFCVIWDGRFPLSLRLIFAIVLGRRSRYESLQTFS